MDMDAQAAELRGLTPTPPWHDRSREYAADGCTWLAAQVLAFSHRYDGLMRGRDRGLVVFLETKGAELAEKARTLRTRRAPTKCAL
jgi:hypothetical protein